MTRVIRRLSFSQECVQHEQQPGECSEGKASVAISLCRKTSEREQGDRSSDDCQNSDADIDR
jgi:hypothetical protein